MHAEDQHDEDGGADQEASCPGSGWRSPGRRPAGPAGRAAGRPRGGHAATSRLSATASRNSSTRVGSRQAKWVTRPVASAAASTCWSSAPAASSRTVSPPARRRPGPRGRRRPSRPARRGRRRAAGGRGLRAQLARPCRWPRSGRGRGCRPRRRAARPGPAGGWRTRPARRARHCSSSASASESTPTGSRPENGSSRTSTSGSLTRAAASCTRCWLPSDSFSTRSPRRSPSPSRSAQLVGGAGGRGGVQAVQPGEVDELLADPHLRVEAALLGHVADPAADLLVDRAAVPAHLPGVGADQAHRDAHRGRLAGAVGAAEAEHLTGRDGEADPVEHLVVPVALVQPVELEHRSSRRRGRLSRHRIGRVHLAPGRLRAVSSTA